jgi:tetratricopeptide (TPR) repeat protein
LLEVEFVHGPQDPTLLLSLSEAFVEKGDYERVIAIYKHIINIPNLPSVSALYAALAAAYVQVDELDLAVEAAQKAAELDPDFAREAEYFIQLIEEGRIDELKETTG